jgi:two-component system, chemotaxis family, protein-glutamate methylesterase/glutaminase
VSASRAGALTVVVVEDSAVQRAHLVDVLEADGDIRVIGEAADAAEAIAMVARLRPNVVTMDLHIPEGGGQYALEQIMAHTPTPVLVLSSTVQSDTSASAVEALVGGALLAVPKPRRWTPALESELRRNVRTIRQVPVVRHLRGRLRPTPRSGMPSAASMSTRPATRTGSSSDRCVVAMAASTGGPPALAAVLAGLADVSGPIMIVQHIHADFVAGLITWMERISPFPVVLARHGSRVLDRHVYIGPGGTHLRLGPDRTVHLTERPASVHRPSADQLFESVARHAGANSVGVLLTGMGDDGAAGLAMMHGDGAHTIVQDKETSAVYGMPRAAKLLGAATQELPLGSIADAVVRAASTRRSATP